MSKLKALLGESYKENMTLEEIDAALESVSLPDDLRKENDKLKKALDKSNSEAAESKRKLQEKQTAEEKAKEEQEQATKALQEELATLRKEKALSDNKAKLLAVGYDTVLSSFPTCHPPGEWAFRAITFLRHLFLLCRNIFFDLRRIYPYRHRR